MRLIVLAISKQEEVKEGDVLRSFDHSEVRVAALLPGVRIEISGPHNSDIWISSSNPGWKNLLRYRAVVDTEEKQ